MASDEIDLKLLDLFLRNPDARQLSEPGVYPLDRLTGLYGTLHQPATLQERAPGFLADRYLGCGITCNADYVLDGKRTAVKNTV